MNFNRVDGKGNSALHHGAVGGSLAICKLLVKAGVKGGRNWEGRGYTPVEVATDPSLAEWLSKHSGPSYSHGR
jgi:hypothetical protein